MSKFIIIVENGYEDSELIYPYYRLKEIDGVEVIIASSSGDQLQGKHGSHSLKPDITIDQLKNLNDYISGVLIPGGFESPEKMRNNPLVLDFIRNLHKEGKLISAICHGVWVLISANIINGVNATCYPGMKDDVINAGGNYSDRPVIVDGNIVTGRRPRDLSFFMKEVISAIELGKNK
ncbi:MAG TPA: type 1 glutamine amidotransferase domain-containing protein [Candidatus Doudnabacteria bacterium]|nr:type 1 glutamine amidotransferase domain-containing protein [Candidatus Doudnabacteria bacterium]